MENMIFIVQYAAKKSIIHSTNKTVVDSAHDLRYEAVNLVYEKSCLRF